MADASWLCLGLVRPGARSGCLDAFRKWHHQFLIRCSHHLLSCRRLSLVGSFRPGGRFMAALVLAADGSRFLSASLSALFPLLWNYVFISHHAVIGFP